MRGAARRVAAEAETLSSVGTSVAVTLRCDTRGSVWLSGDGGWIIGPHVAELLSAIVLVVGCVKAYLSGFTSRESTLRAEEETGDYRVLAEFAMRATGKKPILIGVSEGAGLSVLAATDPDTKAAVTGVIGLGLPNLNELAWRWKDMLIYLTHRAPNEPGFRARPLSIGCPIPLAAIHQARRIRTVAGRRCARQRKRAKVSGGRRRESHSRN